MELQFDDLKRVFPCGATCSVQIFTLNQTQYDVTVCAESVPSDRIWCHMNYGVRTSTIDLASHCYDQLNNFFTIEGGYHFAYICFGKFETASRRFLTYSPIMLIGLLPYGNKLLELCNMLIIILNNKHSLTVFICLLKSYPFEQNE